MPVTFRKIVNYNSDMLPCAVQNSAGWEKRCHISSKGEKQPWTVTHIPNASYISAMSALGL